MFIAYTITYTTTTPTLDPEEIDVGDTFFLFFYTVVVVTVEYVCGVVAAVVGALSSMIPSGKWVSSLEISVE